jgi:hypothetical protein
MRFGSLRRTTPISERWGADRGMPIDRYYIERFLGEHGSDIRGAVLEVRDRRYTERFGTAVSTSDILDVDENNRDATLVADLGDPAEISGQRFDCFILTQTLQFIFPLETAIRQGHNLLRPGGVLLATVPAVSRIDHHYARYGDFWRFTPASTHRLFGGVFGDQNIEVNVYGNVLAAISFLTGLAREDLSDEELDVRDELFPVLIGVRATKATSARA